MRKLCFYALCIAMLSLLAPHRVYAAGDMSGIHAFFNDDRNQFVDFWLNTNGKVTVKVSNGRPWSPMWVVLHATFLSGNQVLGKKDYHVYCGSSTPGGHGNEKWFVYGPPAVAGVTAVSISTNKEKPWGKPQGGWEIEVSGSTSN